MERPMYALSAEELDFLRQFDERLKALQAEADQLVASKKVALLLIARQQELDGEYQLAGDMLKPVAPEPEPVELESTAELEPV